MTITYPHIVIRARLQDHRSPKKSFLNQKLNKYGNTITSVIKNTYTKEGLKGLYSGLKIDLIRVLPANSITFLVFEYVKRRFEEALSCDKKM